MFRFYDDNKSGFLSPDELTDVVWDIYTSDIQNDRVAYQQLLEKVLVTKLYSRHYQEFDRKNLFGKWGRNNNNGDWKNYRFNDYQMNKMKKLNYDFSKAKKRANMKKEMMKMSAAKRTLLMQRLQKREQENDTEYTDVEDLEEVDDSDSNIDYESDAEDEEDIEEEVRSWNRGEKKLLRRYTAMYGAKKNERAK